METYTLTLTPAMISVLGKALSALPLGEAYHTFTAIEDQVRAQDETQAPASPSAEAA